jgi:hypothetical protein
MRTTQKSPKQLKNQLEAEIVEYVHTLLSIHNFDSIKKFRESITSILFRIILHEDQVTTEIEKALVDLQHINRFLTNLEKFEAESRK